MTVPCQRKVQQKWLLKFNCHTERDTAVLMLTDFVHSACGAARTINISEGTLRARRLIRTQSLTKVPASSHICMEEHRVSITRSPTADKIIKQ